MRTRFWGISDFKCTRFTLNPLVNIHASTLHTLACGVDLMQLRSWGCEHLKGLQFRQFLFRRSRS